MPNERTTEELRRENDALRQLLTAAWPLLELMVELGQQATTLGDLAGSISARIRREVLRG